MCEILLSRPHHSVKINILAEKFRHHPDMCYTQPQQRMETLHMNKRIRATIRQLLYLRVKGKTALFGPCTCGTRGCLNPNHQNVLETKDD